MDDVEDWWGPVEEETLRCLTEHGPLTPAELGKHLGLSEDGASSLIAQLVREGRARICLIAAA